MSEKRTQSFAIETVERLGEEHHCRIVRQCCGYHHLAAHPLGMGSKHSVASWPELDSLSDQLERVRLVVVRVDQFQPRGGADGTSHEVDALLQAQANERDAINLLDEEASRQPCL